MSPAALQLEPADLAELIASFNEVTGRLQATHEALRGEVSRLEAELRSAHDQLRRARELAALGEMAAGIAHEVRNPLGSIRLDAQLLTADLADRPDQRAVADRIAQAVSRLDAVVGDVLAFSRELAIRPVEVDARRLLDDAAEACTDMFARAGVRLHRCLPVERPLVLACDPLLMHQALVNVIRNAVEAVAEDGSNGVEPGVWLSAGARRAAEPDGRRRDMIALAVRDSGPGIPAYLIPKLFTPFFTTRHTGTGLGLAIVHRIIDAHRGRVEVHNNTSPGPAGAPARGATFEFLLPVAAE